MSGFGVSLRHTAQTPPTVQTPPTQGGGGHAPLGQQGPVIQGPPPHTLVQQQQRTTRQGLTLAQNRGGPPTVPLRGPLPPPPQIGHGQGLQGPGQTPPNVPLRGPLPPPPLIGHGHVLQNQGPPPHQVPTTGQRTLQRGPCVLSKGRSSETLLASARSKIGKGDLADPKLSPEKKLTLTENLLSEMAMVIRHARAQGNQDTEKQAEAMVRFLGKHQEVLKSEVGQAGLHDLKPEFVDGVLKDELRHSAGLIAKGAMSSLNDAAKDLGNTLAAGLRQPNDPQVKSKLLTSTGDKFKSQLLENLNRTHGQSKAPTGLGSSYAKCSPEVREFLDKTYASFVARATGNRQISDGQIRLEGQTFDSVAQQGVDKDKPISQGGAKLAEGGFGNVYLFHDTGTGEQLVVKSIKTDPTDNLEETQQQREHAFKANAHELDIHVRAQGGVQSTHPNIVGFKGAVNTGDSLLIGLEMCSGGTVHDATDKTHALARGQFVDGGGQIHQLQGTPQDHQRAANLMRSALSKDMAKGLKQMHDNGVAHMDFKGPNVLIGANGLGKIADFGSGVKMEQGVATFNRADAKASIPDNPRWVSPEMLALKDEGFKSATDMKAALNNFIARDLKTYMAAKDNDGQPIPPDKRVKPDFDKMESLVLNCRDPQLLNDWNEMRPKLKSLLDEVEAEVSKPNYSGISKKLTAKLNDGWVEPLKTLSNIHSDRIVEQTRSGPTSPGKNDVWSLGQTMMELFYGAEPLKPDSPFMSPYVDSIRSYGDPTRTDTISDVRKQQWAGKNGQLAGNAPSDPVLDDLLDHMMHRDPNLRYTPDQVLAHPFFTNQANLDSAEVRNLIKAMTLPGANGGGVDQALARV